MGEKKSSFRTLVRDSYKNLTLRKLYPARYRAACKADVIPGRVVFLEIREKGLSDNFRMIRAALEKRNQHRELSGEEKKNRAGDASVQGIAGERDPEWTMSVVCIREGMENRSIVVKNCLKAIPQLARAQFIFVNEVSYFLSCLPMRPETTVIQTWHACGAFKKFGYSAVGSGFGTTREDLDAYPVHGNFSYVTVSSPEVIWAYAEAFHMEDRVDRILPVGVSRTDMFFSSSYRRKACGKVAWILRRMAPDLFLRDQRSSGRSDPASSRRETSREIMERIGDIYSDKAADREHAQDLAMLPGRKILLYAPTFRGTVGRAAAPDALDLPLMKKALGRDYILLINHHPFIRAKDRPKIPDSCRNFAFDMTDQVSIEELLTAADICITDYSSLIFEYSLFERPMVFFAYDMERYLDERGFYYPVSDMMPGPVCRTTSELVEVLQDKDAEFDLARVRAFKYRFMSGCDGHATARVLKLMGI